MMLATCDCPLCGSPAAVPSLDAIIEHIRPNAMQRAALEALWDGHGLPVETEAIFEAMYADDPSGGPSPTRMYAAKAKVIDWLQPRLEEVGIVLESVWYKQGYRLHLR